MTKIKHPTDLIIKENALKILWEQYLITKDKKIGSSYKIARILGIDTCHALDYMKRWAEYGLLKTTVMENKDRKYIYFSLNPEFFKIRKKSVSFEVNGIEITLKKKEQ